MCFAYGSVKPCILVLCPFYSAVSVNRQGRQVTHPSACCSNNAETTEVAVSPCRDLEFVVAARTHM